MKTSLNGEGNSHPSPRNPETPKQDKPKVEHTKTHINQTNEYQTQRETRLSDFTFTFHLHALEKEMATHSSVLAWRIPGTGEPGGLPSVGSHRVRHD